MRLRALKAVERAGRRALITALNGIAASRRTHGAAAGSFTRLADRPRRVLFLRPDRIGDMIVSTGVMRAIAHSSSDIILDVLASPANAPIARAEPWVHDVIVFDRRRSWRMGGLVARLRATHYDAVIDCMPTAPSVTTLMLMLATGARERVGVAGRGNEAALTIAVPPRAGARHIVDHLSSLAGAFGVDVAATDFTPVLTVRNEERAWALRTWQARGGGHAPGARLLVNVSAGKTARQWPDRAFAQVLARVAHTMPNVQTILVGNPSEPERVAAIAGVAGVPMVHTRTIREAIALVATASVVVTPDTGLAHAAAALRRPGVVLHRRGSSALWGLYGAPGCVLESSDRTLRSIRVADVWNALETLLHTSEAPRLIQPADVIGTAAAARATRLEPFRHAAAEARP